MKKLLLIGAMFLATAQAFCSIHFLRPKKTGSTTIVSLLKEQLDPSLFYEDHCYNLCKVKTVLEAKSKVSNMKKIEEDHIVVGHFPMWFFENKADPSHDACRFVTLRDPVERVLSQYRYMKKANESVTLFEIQPNHMCRILSSNPSLSGEALLKSAISNLHKMDLVIFLEDFECGVKELFSHLGLKEPPLIPIHNATKKQLVSQSKIDKIRQINSLDVALYEYARVHFGRS